LAPIPAEILDEIVCDRPLTAEEIDTAWRRFKKALIERALGGELTHHLRYPPGAAKPGLATNHRNGTSGKTVPTDDGPAAIEVPRDREGTFEPQLIGKHERRFTGFDGQLIALYARGLTVREIRPFSKRPMRGAKFWIEVFTDLKNARLSGHPHRRHRRAHRHGQVLAVFPANDAADVHCRICCDRVLTLRIENNASRSPPRYARSTRPRGGTN
jgi:transposase-like protein